MIKYLSIGAAISVLVIFLGKVIIKKNKSEIKKGDIRFNYKHKHLSHIKKAEGEHPNQKATSVFLSSNKQDEGKDNIPMDKPLKVGENKPDAAYFIKRVRTYPTSSYSKQTLDQKLSKKDEETSDKLYKKQLDNQKLMKKRNKKRLAPFANGSLANLYYHYMLF